MHKTSETPILYLGTPVVLVSTTNEDGSPNLAPMSSAWWLGWRCLLGFGARSKTPQNMLRTGECVLNLPSTANVEAVNRLAKTTGSNPLPPGKIEKGYRHEKDKFGIAGLTPMKSETVAPPRVLECPIQLEATVVAVHKMEEDDPELRGSTVAIEVRIQRVHLEESILVNGNPNRIDPDKWRPLIMSFQHFYGLESHKLHESTLAQIPESMYWTPDIAHAQKIS